MFHRVKSESAQKPNPAPQAAQSSAQTPHSAKSAAESRPVQQQASQPQQAPQHAAKPQQPAQDTAQLIDALTKSNTPNTPKKEEAHPMTDQTKKPETAAAQDSAPRALEIPGSAAYQRPGQPPVRTAGNFPGSYPGYNPHVTTALGREISTDRRLIIGRGITMSGEIESCDHLIVEGTVEATLKGASVLDIAESGVFYGTVEIDEATIAGRFEGDIQINGRLTIRAGGAITGSISYKELEVEAGATIDGRISPIGAAGEAKKNPPKPAKKKESEAANNDGELFGKAAAAE
jgi:cytoskeletal protein CcmA (bactofilin family)